MHKRRERGWSTHDEAQLQLKSFTENGLGSEVRRLEKRAWWDEHRPDGEGTTQAGMLYQWVRVTNSKGKVLGTFYLGQMDQELTALFLVTPRKGLPPNPYDETFLSRSGWSRSEFELGNGLAGTPGYEDVRVSGGESRAILANSGLWDAHKNHEQRAVTGVVPVPSADGDTRFKFQAKTDSFLVRGSKLGPVLLGFRRAGKQHVTLEMLRAALKYVA